MQLDREMALANQMSWASINCSAKIRATWTKEARKRARKGRSTAMISEKNGKTGCLKIAQKLARFADPKS